MSYFLAQDLADLDAYLEGHSSPRQTCGLDTETTGLDHLTNKLVGICFSLAKETGIYIPVGHKVGTNVPLAPVIERLDNVITQRDLTTVYFAAKFDRTVTLRHAGWAPATNWRDIQEAAYLKDNHRTPRDLKTLAKEDVGFQMARFESLFTPEERKAQHVDLSSKLPERCRDYGCSDADAPLRLDEFYDDVWETFPAAVRVDTQLSDIIATMEFEGGLELDADYIDKHLATLRWRQKALEAVIHRMAGRKFLITSVPQLGKVLFEELRLPHPFEAKRQKGKSGQWVANADVLEALAEQPIAEMIISFRKVSTALSGPLSKLKYLCDHDLRPRFRLNQFQATTFRLSAPGGDPKKDGHTGANAQAIGKGATRNLVGVDLSAKGSAREYLEDLGDEELLMDFTSIEEAAGYQPTKVLTDEDHLEVLETLPFVVKTAREDAQGAAFKGLACFRDHCRKCPAACESQGIDVTRRLVRGWEMVPSIRQAFRAPDGYQLVSLDYDRQEIVIAANLSGEPVWLQSLLDKLDIHAETAKAVFGLTQQQWDALPKWERTEKRERAKNLNFGTLFGATPHTLATRYFIPLVEAEELWNTFRATLPTLFRWIQDVIIDTKAKGYTQTYLFGRRRQLQRFLQSRDRRLVSYAERCAVNTWIQGTGGDATRIAMVKIEHALREVQIMRDVCRLGLQIHDELMYVVRETELDSVIPVLKSGMEFNVKPWTVQLEAGVKVGQVWGKQEAWKAAA